MYIYIYKRASRPRPGGLGDVLAGTTAPPQSTKVYTSTKVYILYSIYVYSVYIYVVSMYTTL